jgi:hypothetical protein
VSIGTSTSVAAALEEPFRRLLQDSRFSGLPLLIETEKSPAPAPPGSIVLDPFDLQNLGTLRRLRASAADA